MRSHEVEHVFGYGRGMGTEKVTLATVEVVARALEVEPISLLAALLDQREHVGGVVVERLGNRLDETERQLPLTPHVAM